MPTLLDPRPTSAAYSEHSALAALERQMLDVVSNGNFIDAAEPCQAITAACYHLRTGGQRVRALLALHAGHCLGLAPKGSQALGAACELLHNASLIHDDLHDRDTHRRGQLSVWHKFGDEVAICAGDLLISGAYLALSRFDQVDRLPVLFAQMHSRVSSAIRGQCAEMKQPSHRISTLDDFKNIALAKSGALLSLPTELALLAAGQEHAVVQARQAAESFAMGYQIYDDLLDFEKDAARHAAKIQKENKPDFISVCNIVLLLQADANCADAKAVAIKMGLQQLSLATSASMGLPLQSGHALQSMAMQLHEKLGNLQ